MANKACCDGCTCPCCKCTCPYCTVLAFVDLLVTKGVCPDAAAKLATDFVSTQCTTNCAVKG